MIDLRAIDDDLIMIIGYGYAPSENDIEGVAALIPGEADECNWHYILKLKDGRWAYATAGCDYSGFGCQDWGYWATAKTARAAADIVLTKEAWEAHNEDGFDIKQQLLAQFNGTQPFALRMSPRKTCFSRELAFAERGLTV